MEKRIATPTVTREILADYQIRLSKALGQNFLIDGNIIEKIVNIAEIKSGDQIIEIGPGIGSLTQALLERIEDGRLFAIEKDERMVRILKELFQAEQLTLIHRDVLDIDWPEFFTENALLDKPVKLAANLPYYITTPIIMGLLEARVPVERYVFMVQKEVAERMVAKPGGKDYGALSIAVQYYTRPEICHIVPPSVFIPQPDVKSAIIKLETNETPPVQLEDERFFFQIVQAIFQQRRKNLKNSLSKAANIRLDRELIEESLQEMGIPEGTRGEMLDLSEIGQLSNILFKGMEDKVN
ncbi:MAG: 16S rRNA (adenine(1518)-N(6)/adenine(1519)-N(6))-dimethyltransferase RsmA [Halanaerobiaceae bacterium]|nr:16S rRNA (adenine(1518)-N(6)/adenine(1519)-N(6))-dimethyltransferase RsmA [Halanaerobiaceae bacterium]